MYPDRLATHLKNRPAEIAEARKNGFKTVAYFPGDYVPEEIIYASGAIPVCLAEGGSMAPVEAASSVMPGIFCPFARAQVGERLLRKNEYYNMIDMLVAPITCQHLRKVAELWEYDGDIKIFKLGVPHQYAGDSELIYYTSRLRALRDKLQELTGNEISQERISTAIGLYNRMRELLKKISLTRRDASPPLRALDFARLNHASFYADPAFMVDVMDTLHRELHPKPLVGEGDAPRLMLIGPNMASGDYRILDLVEACGGKIVVEEVCEGIRYYWRQIESDADLLESLAKGYLRDRLPCAFMRYSSRERLDFALSLVEEFSVSGIIWYELQYCETYDTESYFFSQRMREREIPMLILESDYGGVNVEQMRNRVEAFIEMVNGGVIS